jgi:hypothetical protein
LLSGNEYIVSSVLGIFVRKTAKEAKKDWAWMIVGLVVIRPFAFFAIFCVAISFFIWLELPTLIHGEQIFSAVHDRTASVRE